MPADPREARALRWARTTYAAGNVVLVNRPGRLYCARMVMRGTGQAEQLVALHDAATVVTDLPSLLLILDANNASPDDWPLTPVSMVFLEGLSVEWLGTASAALFVGWEVD